MWLVIETPSYLYLCCLAFKTKFGTFQIASFSFIQKIAFTVFVSFHVQNTPFNYILLKFNL